MSHSLLIHQCQAWEGGHLVAAQTFPSSPTTTVHSNFVRSYFLRETSGGATSLVVKRWHKKSRRMCLVYDPYLVVVQHTCSINNYSARTHIEGVPNVSRSTCSSLCVSYFLLPNATLSLARYYTMMTCFCTCTQCLSVESSVCNLSDCQWERNENVDFICVMSRLE